MQETIFSRSFKRLWVPVLLIFAALAFYMTATHVFWVQLARISGDFSKFFLWLIVGLCGISVLALTGCVGKTTCNLSAVLYFVALMGILFSQLFIGTLFSLTDTVEDPKYYEVALQKTSAVQGSLSGFPEHIPADAQAVKFSYTPGFAQGGEILKLKFEAAPEQLQKYQMVFAHKAVASGTIDSFAQTPYEVVAKSACDFYEEVPKDYFVYILSAQKYDDSWNHGTCSMVGISPEAGEITFFAENW